MGVVRRFPLTRRRPRTAFVMGGGGNLGAVQVGMLRAVLERGFVPDIVVGCSVGALNGAAVAADPTPAGAERLAEMWAGLSMEDIWPAGRLTGPWQVVRRGEALHSNAGLRRVIEAALPIRSFEELAVPFQCVATSLVTGTARWFFSGALVEAILASAALPAVFPPVTIDGDRLIDGGVVDNVPIMRAVELGAQRLMVFHVGNFQRRRPEPKRPIDVLVQAFSIGRGHRFHLDLASLPAGIEATVLPSVEPPGRLRYDDLGRSAELIALGYEAAAAHVDELVPSVER